MILNNRDYSQALALGADHIAKSEAFRADAYPDAGYGWKKPTIGYGTAEVYPSTGEPVRRGDTISEERARHELLLRIAQDLQLLDRSVQVPLSDTQVASLLSFVYNAGRDAFLKSTLLKKLNAGDYEGAKNEMPKWVNTNGKKSPGLVKRRRDDMALFDKPGDIIVDNTFSDIEPDPLAMRGEFMQEPSGPPGIAEEMPSTGRIEITDDMTEVTTPDGDELVLTQ